LKLTHAIVALWSISVCSSCSLQYHGDRAETRWLKANSMQSALHSTDVTFTASESFAVDSRLNTLLNGYLENGELSELSGLAPVQGVDNTYWAINDSGNDPILYAINSQGRHLDAFKLPFENKDWEDLASFTVGDQAWLLVADTGDNLHRRSAKTIYLFKQPKLNSSDSVANIRKLEFDYEDGPANVEAVGVSVAHKEIYLVSKDTEYSTLYSLPLITTADTTGLIAKKRLSMAPLFSTDDDRWWEMAFAKHLLMRPTALDISADDRTAVLANYRHVYLYERQAGESWVQAFARTPQVVSSHRLEQSEALAFSVRSNQIVVGTEGRNSPLLIVVPTKQPL